MWLLLFGLARAEVVDRVVVVVRDTPILQSEIALESALEGVDPAPVPFWTAVGASPTERLVDAAIIRALAADVALYQPTREQVAARLDAVRGAFADASAWDAFLGAHGLDEDRLSAVLRRRMVVERYLLRTLQVPPQDHDRWITECVAHLGLLRPRVRVREVPPGDGVPSEG